MEKETESKRLKPAEWVVIISLWEMGEVTLKELSEKFGVSEAAISQGLKRKGSIRGSKAHLASKEVEAKNRQEKAKLIEDIYSFKKKFLKYGEFLMTLTINEITEAKKAGEKLITRRNEIETIGAATKVYKTIRNDMFHLYDLYNKENSDEDQEEFNIGVYSEKELETLREAQELLDNVSQSTEEEIDDIEEDEED